MQEEKKARAHLFTLLLVRTGCPALLLTDHVTGAPGPASQGQQPLGPQLEQQIKLWRKEGNKDMKWSVLMVDLGEAVELICENQA